MSITISPKGAPASAVQTIATPEVAPVAPQVAPEAKAPATPDPRVEAYLKKERALQTMRKELEAEKAALATERTRYETGYIDKNRLTADPISVLEEAGLGYDKLTELMLARPNDPATRALMAKMKSYDDKLQAIERQGQEREQQQYQQALKQIDVEAKLLIDSDPEYESIKSAGMHSAVTELIEQTWNTEGRLMDVREAAQEVETYLVEEAFKMSQLSKVQARHKAAAPVSAPVKVPQQPQTMKTITQSLPSQPTKRLTEKDRVQRALAAFKGELK